MADTTWKQVVHDCADAYRTATNTTDKVKVSELASRISGIPKEGKHAWQKLTVKVTTVVNPKIHTTSVTDTTRRLSSDDFDITYLTKDNYPEILGGFTFRWGSGRYEIRYNEYGNYVSLYESNEYKAQVKYDPVNQTMMFTLYGLTGEIGDLSYTGTKELRATAVDAYVVSDDETAYPEDGTLNEYQYKKIIN